MPETSAEDYGLLRRLASGRAPPNERDDRVAGLLRRGLLERRDDRLVLSALGATALRRHLAGGEGFAVQHQVRTARTIDDDTGSPRTVIVNEDESPLGRLRRMKGRDGAAMIAAEEYDAGERLRADFTRGQLMPRITANWSAGVAGRRRGGGGGGMAEMSDAIVAARQRVDQALAAVGPDFAGLLLDFCCFLKGIEVIERERNWPSRSAKLVIRLALGSLARHYGLVSTARNRQTGIVHWGAEGYRPEITPAG